MLARLAWVVAASPVVLVTMVIVFMSARPITMAWLWTRRIRATASRATHLMQPAWLPAILTDL